MEFEHRIQETAPSHPFLSSQPMSRTKGNHEWSAEPASQHVPFTPEYTADPTVLQCRQALMSHWADEPERHPVRSKSKRASDSRNGFDQLTSGEHGHSIAMQKAPSEIVLLKEMTQGMQVAWNQSLPLARAQEQGGMLVRNRDGSRKWLRSDPGDANQITLDYDLVDPQQRLLANGHTHPYDKADHNVTDVPFSGRDLAAHVTGQERLSIVQSGAGLFGAARTREFDEMVSALDQRGQEALPKEIERFWQNIYDHFEGTVPQKAEAATRATTDWFHLLYYRGKQGILRRVDTMAKQEAGGK